MTLSNLDKNGLISLLIAAGTCVNTITLICHTYLVASNQAVATELSAIRSEILEIQKVCGAGVKQTGVGNQIINDGGREQTIREFLKEQNKDGNVP